MTDSSASPDRRTVIDLGEFASKGVGILAGRDRGKRAREELGLAERDKAGELFSVEVPSSLYSVNWSFFLGLFGDSIRSMTEDQFRHRYAFTSEYGRELLEEGIRRAKRSGPPIISTE